MAGLQASLCAALPIMVDAVTFFLAAVTLIFLFVPSPKRTDLVGADGQVKKSVWADIKIGGLYIWQRRPLLWLLVLGMGLRPVFKGDGGVDYLQFIFPGIVGFDVSFPLDRIAQAVTDLRARIGAAFPGAPGCWSVTSLS